MNTFEEIKPLQNQEVKVCHIVKFCEPNRDTPRTFEDKLIFSSTKTSPIIGKPLTRKQIRYFFIFLVEFYLQEVKRDAYEL